MIQWLYKQISRGLAIDMAIGILFVHYVSRVKGGMRDV